MCASVTSSDLSQTIILGNSIIGVSILALPYAFQQTGIILGCVMFCIASWINKTSCYLLVRSAILSKQHTYENLAHYSLGSFGKFITEISIVGFLLGICAAYFIVIGDLVPTIVSKWLGIPNDPWLRGWVMAVFALVVILPLSLVDRIDNLNRVSSVCAIFYVLFCLKIFFEALPTIRQFRWIDEIRYWRVEGTFHSLPIIALSLTCQTQIFLIYTTLSEPNYNRMAKIYERAIDSCTCVYVFVGILGYLAFYAPGSDLQGDVLLNLDKSSLITDVVVLGFALSSALSFPLSLLPCRDSFVSLLLALPSTRDARSWQKFDRSTVLGGGKKNSSLPSLDLEDRDDSVHSERRRLIANNLPIGTADQDQEASTCRAPRSAIQRQGEGGDDLSPSDITHKQHPPSPRTKIILTLVIVLTTFLIGLLIPKIEVMLGLIGSLMGTLLACILPSLIFLKVRKVFISPGSIFNESAAMDKILAQVIFSIGILIMVIGTANYLPTIGGDGVSNEIRPLMVAPPPTPNGSSDGVALDKVLAPKDDLWAKAFNDTLLDKLAALIEKRKF